MYFFSGRPKYKQLSSTLKKDIRLHFGTIDSIETEAKTFLFSLGNDELLTNDCESAVSETLGYMDDNKLIFRSTNADYLPLRLKGILAISHRISGALDDVDIMKIHLGSKKVTYLTLDNFDNSPLPRIVKRTVVDLRLNSVFTASYDEKKQVRLFYLKSKLMKATDKNYSNQAHFDARIKEETGFSFDGEGPKFEDFAKKLIELKITPPSYS